MLKIIFSILLLLHGLLHLIGFLHAFHLLRTSPLTSEIPKLPGIGWLLTAVLMIVYAILFFMDNNYSWLPGLIAVLLSQLLVFSFWQDAKFASLPNGIILIVVLFSFASYRMNRMIEKEREHIISQASEKNIPAATRQTTAHLPAPVQNWLEASGIMDRPPILRACVAQSALMKMKAGQENWYPAKAIQHTTLAPPAFIWSVEMEMMPLIKIKGRDKFTAGKGEMLIKLNSWFTVVNEQGEKLNEGSLQRFLGEMVWFPSLALSPYISWEKINEHSAKATMQYRGTTGSGTFHFNAQGDFIKFVALRYKDNTPDSRRYPWVLTVDKYSEFDGIRVPSQMKATWKLEDHDWTWLQLTVDEITYYHARKKGNE